MAKHRRRRRPFTNREANAIKRIAAPLIETKKYISDLSFGTYHYAGTFATAQVPTHQGGFFNNPVGSLPMDVRISTSADPAQPNAVVEGDEIMLRGLKIEGYALVTGNRNFTLRLSLLSGPPYGTGTTVPVQPLANPSPFRIVTSDNIYEENTIYGDATQTPFNNEKFTVLRTKTYKLGYMDGTDTRKFKMFYRMNAHKVAELEPDDADGNRKRMGFQKGKNYYWVFEWFNAAQNIAFTATDNLQVRIQSSVYWKDG